MIEPTVEISLSEDMTARVIREWQEENPLRSIDSLAPDEFARRMMIEILASARVVR